MSNASTTATKPLMCGLSPREQHMQDARTILAQSRHMLSGAEMEELTRVAAGHEPAILHYQMDGRDQWRVPFIELQTEFSSLL